MPPARKNIFDWVYLGSEMLAVVAFIALCLTVSIQVISRYVFNFSFGWAEELPIFIFLWVSFISAAVAFREGSHLSVDFVADRFPAGFQKPLRLINLVLSLVFICLVIFYESSMTLSIRESTFVVIKISKAWCYTGIPLACLIFAIFIIEKLLGRGTAPGVEAQDLAAAEPAGTTRS
jgi:TRAP-type C4-dicarboxylate transport system permease small subunit